MPWMLTWRHCMLNCWPPSLSRRALSTRQSILLQRMRISVEPCSLSTTFVTFCARDFGAFSLCSFLLEHGPIQLAIRSASAWSTLPIGTSHHTRPPTAFLTFSVRAFGVFLLCFFLLEHRPIQLAIQRAYALSTLSIGVSHHTRGTSSLPVKRGQVDSRPGRSAPVSSKRPRALARAICPSTA